MVISGIISIHLLAMEKAEVEQARKAGGDLQAAKVEARNKVMTSLQTEWDASGEGRWTHRLIPTIGTWKNRKHEKISFHLTQFLSGHGCFNHYLHRFKKRNNAECMYCGDPDDDAEHTFIICSRWWRERRKLEVELAVELTSERMVEAMLRCKSEWNAVENFITTNMTKKEADERTIQAPARI